MAHRTHGLSKSTEHIVWAGMKTRCNNPNDPEFSNYGGRGIRVCEAWANDFTTFLRDVGARPSREHTLDRINNEGHYEPGNCRWATRREQAANRRGLRMLTHNDETLTLADWARRIGLSPTAIAQRLRLGWSVADALSPVRYGASRDKPADEPQRRHQRFCFLTCRHCGRTFRLKLSAARTSKGCCSKRCSMTLRNLAAAAAGLRWRRGGAALRRQPAT